MPFIPKIRDFNSRIVLCSMHDVVAGDGSMELRRRAIQPVWANIRPYKNITPYLTSAGYSVLIQETATMLKVTHIITLRANLPYDFTTAAWAYEERRKSPPRWYKIMGFSEDERWTVLPSRLMEKSDFATPPDVGRFTPEQSRVEL